LADEVGVVGARTTDVACRGWCCLAGTTAVCAEATDTATRTAKSGNDILRKKNLRRMTISRRFGTTCPPFFIHRTCLLVSRKPEVARGTRSPT
jgi:hypothetical protein